MTLVLADGFDTALTIDDIMRRYTYAAGSSSASISSGRISGNSLYILGLAGVIFSFPSFIDSGDSIYVGFAMQSDALVSGYNSPCIRFSNTDGEQWSVVMGAAPAIYRATVLVQTGSPLFTAGNWHYIEIKATVKNSTAIGDIIIRIDGSESLSSSAGLDYQRQASNGMTTMSLYGGNILTGGIRYDDLYICTTDGTTNNTFLGDVRVRPIFPNAVGSNSDFTPSDGTSNNYEMVDDTTNDEDTTYVESQTVGHTDTYNFETMAATPYEIKGVAVWGSMKKDDAGNRTLKAVAISDGTSQESTETLYPTAGQYNDEMGIFENDPATGSAWTESGVNNAEFGFKINS